MPTQPAIPTPQFPPDDASVDGAYVTLMWEAVDEATAYQVQVASDEAFAQLLLDESLDPTGSITLMDAHDTIGTVWYWRIRARSKGRWSPYSRPQSYRIVPEEDLVSVGVPAASAVSNRRESAAAVVLPGGPEPFRTGRTSAAEAWLVLAAILLSLVGFLYAGLVAI